MKNISILGSTGSIGTQTLEVVRHSDSMFNIVGLSCKNNVELLVNQSIEFRPTAVAIENEKAARIYRDRMRERVADYCPEIYVGEDGNSIIATIPEADMVVGSMVGISGLKPVVEAIKSHKDIALANKETLVTGGEIVMDLVNSTGVKLLPVDSEHSAIWQCLWGQPQGTLDRILLTASGGPFRGFTREKLSDITLEQALNHPTWRMGGKVTIDSSTMMNKGLEILEASHLFSIDVDHIDVVIHPQSVIHSMIRTCDGSVLAQMGKPNMMMPIMVALNYPSRGERFMEEFDPFASGMNNLTFEKCDMEVFGLLALAYHVGRRGGLLPTVMNGANEVAVSSFLDGIINYLDIERIVLSVTDLYERANSSISINGLDSIYDADFWARSKALEVMNIGKD